MDKTNRRVAALATVVFMIMLHFPCYAEEILMLDYETGEEFSIDASELDKYNAQLTVTDDYNGFWIDYDARYAEIRLASDKERLIICPHNLELPDYLPFYLEGYILPGLIDVLEFPKSDYEEPDGVKDISIEVIESDYKVLGNYDIVAYQILWGEIVHSWKDIDLEGYWPSEICDALMFPPSMAAYKCYFMQYNKQAQTIRAYTHLKVRVNFIRGEKDSIAEVDKEIDTDVPEYFDLQGKTVKSPRKGVMYVKRLGTKTTLEKY